MSIRVLFLAGSLRIGGSERVLTELLRGLDRAAFEPHLTLLAQEGEFLSRVPADVCIHNLGARRARAATLPLALLCWAVRPEVVISFSAQLNAAAILAKPILPPGTRLAVREGANVTLQTVAGQLRYLACRVLYRRADAVICQSKDMACRIAECFGVSQSRLAQIYNPVDPAELQQAARGSSPYKTSGPHLLAAGRLVPVKGMDLLIRAVPAVLRQHPALDLTLLGSGPQEKELRCLAAELGIETAVHFAGPQSNPFPFVRHADLLVVPSRSEALPNAVLEALALGTPVVATDCAGGIREIAALTRGIRLADLHPLALAEAITQSLESFPAKVFVAEAEFLRQFSPARILCSYEQLIENIVAGPKAARGIHPRRAVTP